MAAPTDPRDLDDAISRYLAGQPEPEIISATGVSHSVLHRERSKRGIPPRRYMVLDDAAIVAAYQSGESELSLSKRYGVGRPTIRLRLIRAGVTVRRPSEAAYAMNGALTAEERAARAMAAQGAVRGTKRSESELAGYARGRERNGAFGSDGERLLAALLEERGFYPIPQKAIGRYNVDVAASDTIAVEVLGGNWHARKRIHATRTPYILNAGWHLIFIWNQQTFSPITAGAAEYVDTFAEEVRWHPTEPRQYRVIRGDGKLLSAGSADSKEFALVPPTRGRKAARA